MSIMLLLTALIFISSHAEPSKLQFPNSYCESNKTIFMRSDYIPKNCNQHTPPLTPQQQLSAMQQQLFTNLSCQGKKLVTSTLELEISKITLETKISQIPKRNHKKINQQLKISCCTLSALQGASQHFKNNGSTTSILDAHIQSLTKKKINLEQKLASTNKKRLLKCKLKNVNNSLEKNYKTLHKIDNHCASNVFHKIFIVAERNTLSEFQKRYPARNLSDIIKAEIRIESLQKQLIFIKKNHQ